MLYLAEKIFRIEAEGDEMCRAQIFKKEQIEFPCVNLEFHITIKITFKCMES